MVSYHVETLDLHGPQHFEAPTPAHLRWHGLPHDAPSPPRVWRLPPPASAAPGASPGILVSDANFQAQTTRCFGETRSCQSIPFMLRTPNGGNVLCSGQVAWPIRAWGLPSIGKGHHGHLFSSERVLSKNACNASQMRESLMGPGTRLAV